MIFRVPAFKWKMEQNGTDKGYTFSPIVLSAICDLWPFSHGLVLSKNCSPTD